MKPLTIQYEGQQISLTSQKLSELMQKAVKEELAQIKAGNTTAKKFKFIETPVQKLKKRFIKLISKIQMTLDGRFIIAKTKGTSLWNEHSEGVFGSCKL